MSYEILIISMSSNILYFFVEPALMAEGGISPQTTFEEATLLSTVLCKLENKGDGQDF